MKQDELIEAMARAITLCPVCEGEGTVCDGLDEAGCSIPCPPCSGTGYDARAILPVIRAHLEPNERLINVGVGAILTSKERPAIISQHDALAIAFPAMLAASPIGEIG